MASPVARVDGSVVNGVAAVEHPVIAHVDAHMGRARGVIGLFKENKVARAGAFRRDVGAHAPQPLRAQPAEAPMQAAVVVDIRNEAGAVEGGVRRAAAPDVRVKPLIIRTH